MAKTSDFAAGSARPPGRVREPQHSRQKCTDQRQSCRGLEGHVRVRSVDGVGTLPNRDRVWVGRQDVDDLAGGRDRL